MSTLPLATEFISFSKATTAPATWENYERAITRLNDWKGDQKITPALLQKYLTEMSESGLRRSTVTTYHATLNSYFEFAVDRGVWKSNPLPKPDLPNTQPKAKPIFTVAEYERLKTAAESYLRPLWKEVIVTLWHTGFRISDVAQLKWGQVDLGRAEITIIPSKQRRFGKVVTVPIASELSSILIKLRPEIPPVYVFKWFADCINYPGARTQLASDFARIATMAQVPFTSVHGLRRSFVSRLANAGVSPAVICSMTGHDLKEIMTYVQISPDTKAEAMKLINL